MVLQEIARLVQVGRRQPFQELFHEHEVERRVGALAHQLGERQADGAGDAAQQHDRDIALADFQLGEIALGDFRVLSQHLARHAALIAQGAHALAEAAQIEVAVARRRNPGCASWLRGYHAL